MHSILYITTNSMWSGSEELWARSAKTLAIDGYQVSFAAKFDHPELALINGKRFILPDPFAGRPLFKRVIDKITRADLPVKTFLKKLIQHTKPRLVIISQGNNADSLVIMQTCMEERVPYVTLTQLVTEVHFSAFNNEYLPLHRKNYLLAAKNYFVSRHNLRLNNLMLGIELPNAEVVYNPCKVTSDEVPCFPEVKDRYDIGLVGRLECLHKGYDLLLQVANKEKWKQRPVQFNLYGSGPHEELLKANIAQMGIKNIFLKGPRSNVSEIWKENHLLCLPSRMEGQALVLIEAMYCNRAAVVTNVGGAAELIEEEVNGFIAPAPTMAELDAALERAWEKRANWKEMGVKAGATIRQKHPEDAVVYFNHKILELLGS